MKRDWIAFLMIGLAMLACSVTIPNRNIRAACQPAVGESTKVLLLAGGQVQVSGVTWVTDSFPISQRQHAPVPILFWELQNTSGVDLELVSVIMTLRGPDGSIIATNGVDNWARVWMANFLPANEKIPFAFGFMEPEHPEGISCWSDFAIEVDVRPASAELLNKLYQDVSVQVNEAGYQKDDSYRIAGTVTNTGSEEIGRLRGYNILITLYDSTGRVLYVASTDGRGNVEQPGGVSEFEYEVNKPYDAVQAIPKGKKVGSYNVIVRAYR